MTRSSKPAVSSLLPFSYFPSPGTIAISPPPSSNYCFVPPLRLQAFTYPNHALAALMFMALYGGELLNLQWCGGRTSCCTPLQRICAARAYLSLCCLHAHCGGSLQFPRVRDGDILRVHASRRLLPCAALSGYRWQASSSRFCTRGYA